MSDFSVWLRVQFYGEKSEERWVESWLTYYAGITLVTLALSVHITVVFINPTCYNTAHSSKRSDLGNNVIQELCMSY